MFTAETSKGTILVDSIDFVAKPQKFLTEEGTRKHNWNIMIFRSRIVTPIILQYGVGPDTEQDIIEFTNAIEEDYRAIDLAIKLMCNFKRLHFKDD